MPNGTVKFFNAAKGFGFITSDESHKDVFVPAASITASGLSTLKTGQRVLFEETPDGKGPKATNLKLLETPPEIKAPRPEAAPRPVATAQWTLYGDPAFEETEEVLTALRAAGHEPRIVDYMASPPNRDELKRLAALLRGADQSLVRKYDHLFGELRLDDRFISENDFWDAVVEHPSLINGPVVASGGRASICHSEEALNAFLTSQSPDGPKAEVKPKTLSPRLLSLMMGETPPPAPIVVVAEAEEPTPRAESKKIVLLPRKVQVGIVKPAEKPAPVPAKAPAPKAVAKPKPAPKPVKVVAKKSAPKPKKR